MSLREKDLFKPKNIEPEPVSEDLKLARGIWTLKDPSFPTWFVPNSPNGTRETISFEGRRATRKREDYHKFSIGKKPIDTNLPQGLDVTKAYEALAERYGSETSWGTFNEGQLGADRRTLSYIVFPMKRRQRFSEKGLQISARLVSVQNAHYSPETPSTPQLRKHPHLALMERVLQPYNR